MDRPSVQLQENLHSAIREAVLSHRPILTHLNADTSWLLQLPYPPDAVRPPERSRFNIILDPWFRGPQSDVARFFSTQWHVIESSVQTMAELEERLAEIEQIVQRCNIQPRNRKHARSRQSLKKSYIDAVVISHEFTDHCNKQTLLELDPNTPIFATRLAVNLIISWKYFNLVQEIPPFSTEYSDWRDASLHPLPSWIGISRMVTESDALYYHSAILIAFDIYPKDVNRGSEKALPAEAIIYSPHGIYAHNLRHLTRALPPVRTLALLHGLHDIRISVKQLNLGAHNGLQAQRMCQAKYWVSTHDEIKKESGFITAFLNRKVLTLQEALSEERSSKGRISDESELADMKGVTFTELASGESLLLG